MKFLLGGIATVAGLVLLFVASFGDPAQLPQQLYTTVSAEFFHHPAMNGRAGAPDANAQPAAAHPASAVGHGDATSAQEVTEHEAVQRQLLELQKEAEQSLRASPPASSRNTQAAQNAGAAEANAQTAKAGTGDGNGSSAPPAPTVPNPAQQRAAAAAQQHAAQVARQQALQAQQAARVAAAQEAEGKAAAKKAAAQEAALLQQREALEKQLDQLHAQMAAASHDVASLHVQADAERHAVDALQQRQATEQAKLDQLEAQREAAAAAARAAAVRQAAAHQRAAHAAVVAKAAVSPAAAPAVAPPVAPAPAGPPKVASRPEAAPVPKAAATPLPKAASVAVASHRPPVHAARRSSVAEGDSGAVEAVLDRLRRQAHLSQASAADAEQGNAAAAAQGHHQYQGSNSNPVAQGGNPGQAGSGNAPAFQPPPQVDARQHLGMARAALVAGDLDDARQDLEEAQLQLVFRPVTPTADQPPQASQAAGDVAEALSMLGAGDVGTALQYVDRALGDAGQSGVQTPPAQAYGYASPGVGYGGPAQTAYGQ